MGEAKRQTCIFCGKTPLTKEHIWPDWLRDYFEIKPTDKNSSWMLESEAKSVPMTVKASVRPGNLITKKLRVVCKECNNGWMSKIEEGVKPLFLSVIDNSISELPQSDICNLAIWTALKIMVCEYTGKDLAVTPKEDRHVFYESNKIPDYFRIYIGRHDTKIQSALTRNSAVIAKSTKGPNPPLNGLHKNTQSFGMIFDKLFIYVIACRESGLAIEKNFNLELLTTIYPNSKTTLFWDDIKIIDQMTIISITSALERFISSDKVIYGGQLGN